MFRTDLEPYFKHRPRITGDFPAVGWLDISQPFDTGFVPELFARRIRALCQYPIALKRGFHPCTLCKSDPVCGNGEIHIASKDGSIYIAPSMISHYVDDHKYLPPQEFVDAVLGLQKLYTELPDSDLARSIFAYADSATDFSRSEFLDLFVQSRVCIRAPLGMVNVPAGGHIATDSTLEIPNGISPEGEKVLIVMTDAPVLSIAEPSATFIELSVIDVLNIARNESAGVLIQVACPRRKAWAIVRSAEVSGLLSR